MAIRKRKSAEQGVVITLKGIEYARNFLITNTRLIENILESGLD